VTFRRLLAGLAAILATFFMLGAPAANASGTYPPTSPAPQGDISVTPTTTTVGGSVTVSGTGFGDCPVTLRVNVGKAAPYITRVLTPTGGSVSTVVKITKGGTNTITLTGCTPSGGTQVLTTRVTVRGSANSGGLPGTGGDLTSLYAGVGLLAAGSLLVGVTRQRRKVTI
jgi:hypothetical protein